MPHEFVGVPQFVTAAICRAFYVVSTTLHCVARQATQAKARRARGAITLGIIQISYATASIRASSTDSEEEAAATARASRHRTIASRRPPAAAGTSRPSYSSHASHSNTRCAPSRRPAACTRRRSAATRSRSSGRWRPSSDSRSTFYPSNSSRRTAPRDARGSGGSRGRTPWLASPAS